MSRGLLGIASTPADQFDELVEFGGVQIPHRLEHDRESLYDLSINRAGHPVVVSTAACCGRQGGGPAHDGRLHEPRPRPRTDRGYAVTPHPVTRSCSAGFEPRGCSACPFRLLNKLTTRSDPLD